MILLNINMSSRVSFKVTLTKRTDENKSKSTSIDERLAIQPEAG
jgi:hypothetical protein